jgi:hypothetical protein
MFPHKVNRRGQFFQDRVGCLSLDHARERHRELHPLNTRAWFIWHERHLESASRPGASVGWEDGSKSNIRR